MVRYLFLLSILLFSPLGVFADFQLDTITGNDSYQGWWSEQAFPSPGKVYPILLAPQSVLSVRQIEIPICWNKVTGDVPQVRANIWVYSNDNFRLLAYSDWVTPPTSNNACANYLSLTGMDSPTLFDFGTITTLAPGSYYYISVNATPTPAITGTYLYQATVASSSVPEGRYGLLGVTQHSLGWDIYPHWGLGPISGSEFGDTADNVPAIRLSEYYTGVGSSSVPFISIDDVRISYTTGTTTATTSAACKHRSDDSEYYVDCPFILPDGAVVTSLGALGVYQQSTFEWLDSYLLNNQSRVLDYQMLELTDTTGYYQTTFPLTYTLTSGSAQLFVLRNSLRLDSQAQSGTAQVAVSFCTDAEDCATAYSQYTVSGDGVTVNTTPEGSTWLSDWLTQLWSTYKYLWPWGYLTRTYDEYEAQQSASSSPLAIPLDMSRFGLPATDTEFDLVAWASVDRWKNDPDYAGIAAGLEAFDKFMYGLLAMFLLYRLWSGVWTHGLDAGIARRKAQILESRDWERAAYFSDLRNKRR